CERLVFPMNITNLSNLQLDMLKEIGNIGAGNAATSLSKLINKRVDMQVPSVKIVAFQEVMNIIGGSDQMIVAILFQVQVDILGTVYFILSKNEAEKLINQMIPSQQMDLFNGEEINELSASVLREVGNILTGSYLTALSDFLKVNVHPSIPYFSVDMAGAILTVGLIELSQVTDYAIIIDTKMNGIEAGNGVNGQFFFMPEPKSVSKVFKTLGIEKDE